jgi:hypothetical protein
MALASTDITGFSLLEVHDQNFYSVLEKYVFRNKASSSMTGEVGLSVQALLCAP